MFCTNLANYLVHDFEISFTVFAPLTLNLLHMFESQATTGGELEE